MQVSTIGLDLAKQVFQVHGVDAAGVAVLKRRLRRPEVVSFFSTLPRCLDRHRSVRNGAPLGSRTVGAWPRRETDPAIICEGLCETRQDRRGRCRGDLRGRIATQHAVRTVEICGAAIRANAAPVT
jgi:transposase